MGIDLYEALRETHQILNPPPKTNFRTQIGHWSTAESSEDYSFNDSQIRITPIQRSFAGLLVRGFSIPAACRELNLNPNTARRWADAEWFEPVCETERQKWFASKTVADKTELFATLMGKAFDALRELLSSEDEKIRLAAVNFVVTQFFGGVEKQPIGRPRKPEPEVGPPDLGDIQTIAARRISAMRDSVNGSSNHIEIRANG